MIGYVLLHVGSNELEINCTDDMSIENWAESGRIWTDRGLAEAARDAVNSRTFPSDTVPVYLFEVMLP